MSAAASVLYVANATGRDIAVFSLDAGEAPPRLLQRLPVDGMVMPMAVSPDRRRLYAAIRSEPFRAAVFAIDPASGVLSALGEAALPHSMVNLSLDRSGRFLFGASYHGDLLSVSPIPASGIPDAPVTLISGVPRAHQLSVMADNAQVWASALGCDQLRAFTFDADCGSLTPGAAPVIQLPAGTGPRHFTCSRDERFCYVLGELDGCVHILQREDGTLSFRPLQRISVLPAGLAGQPAAAELRLTPDGRFLYASERATSMLAGFRVDAETGRLHPLAHWPTEAKPRAFCLAADGRQLFVVGQRSHQLSHYRIDPETGALHLLGRIPVGENPAWIEYVALR